MVLFIVECPLSPTLRIGSTVVIALQGWSTGNAITGVIGIVNRTRKDYLVGCQPRFKLFAFKGVVFFQGCQQILFTVLAETKTFFPQPPYRVSYNDFRVGCPELLFLLELIIVAVMFLWAFSPESYQKQKRSGSAATTGPLIALLSCLSPVDIFIAFFSGFLSYEKQPSVEKGVYQPASDAREGNFLLKRPDDGETGA